MTNVGIKKREEQIEQNRNTICRAFYTYIAVCFQFFSAVRIYTDILLRILTCYVSQLIELKEKRKSARRRIERRTEPASEDACML